MFYTVVYYDIVIIVFVKIYNIHWIIKLFRRALMDCGNKDKGKCPCTYPCSHHGKCCECVAYHLPDEFPACFFSEEAERKYDRSYSALKKDREK